MSRLTDDGNPRQYPPTRVEQLGSRVGRVFTARSQMAPMDSAEIQRTGEPKPIQEGEAVSGILTDVSIGCRAVRMDMGEVAAHNVVGPVFVQQAGCVAELVDCCRLQHPTGSS